MMEVGVHEALPTSEDLDVTDELMRDGETFLSGMPTGIRYMVCKQTPSHAPVNKP